MAKLAPETDRKLKGIRAYSSQIRRLFGSEAEMERAVRERAEKVGEAGGFGPAPKFPRPSELLFLFHEAYRAIGVGDELLRRSGACVAHEEIVVGPALVLHPVEGVAEADEQEVGLELALEVRAAMTGTPPPARQ